jgi:peptidoglycan/xylan/chitin deacetylase (PgdA/CDA1 family)
MKAIKLVVGATPTCWRPPYGDVDDRVRAIAHALGLRTVIWQYHSNDWHEGSNNVTAADVDQNYKYLIARAQNGTYTTINSFPSFIAIYQGLTLLAGGHYHAHTRAQQLYHVQGYEVLHPTESCIQVPRSHGCCHKSNSAIRRD